MGRIFNSKKGSSTVEAALLIPLLILIIVTLVNAGIKLEKRVEESSKEHVYSAEDVLKSKIDNPEKIIRARWVIK